MNKGSTCANSSKDSPVTKSSSSSSFSLSSLLNIASKSSSGICAGIEFFLSSGCAFIGFWFEGKSFYTIASIVRYIPQYYQFQSLGEYTALLKLLNIDTEKVEGELHGEHRRGLMYFALDENGEKASNPFKSSLFGKKAGLPSLEKQMEQHKPQLNKQDKSTLKQHIKNALKTTQSKAEFRKALIPYKISVVFRENDQGRLYGVTFIDHNTRCVWNGSRLGKSYAIVNNYIKQQIEKGFSMYIYDFKFDDLSTIAYNHLLKHLDKYEIKPQFYVINFDDPRKSHRCNPINPQFMTDISDAYESAYTIMLNLNRTWIQKQGDFFVESPIILLAAIIWFLKIYENGKYCTFPHAIELLNKPYADIFTILTSYTELENYLSPFMDAWQGGAQDQLQGQIASAKIPLSRMISPQLYWVMTGDDFSLDINNPKEPKILCVGNNPDRQNIYSAALGLYNSRIVKLINKKGQLKSSVIIDELPTIYFRGLDNLIATARSNKVAVCLGFQDFSQLTRDYGDKESKVIQNTVGNIFSGQVVGETAKTLSERFGKVLQKRQSMTINRSDKSTSISTQMDSLIPPSKISNLTQGMFVGSVSDNFDQHIDQKIFHAQIVVDNEKVAKETKAYKKIPNILSFSDEEMKQQVEANYKQIKTDIVTLVESEMERIANDPDLQHLVEKEG
ncbi:TraM recognition domain-containing protein [Riemerella anatipestifer]|nr:TraM recognition domain-containing protein [Riemerella anatipestifer]